MNKENSKITIIMATYNRAHFIVETLRSIQNQTHENWECLIIDDGGADNTKAIITTFLIQDQRFKYLERPNKYKKGLSGCRNYGLDIATGDYIIFFDDDDIVHPQNLEIGIELLKKSPELYFCHYIKQAFKGNFDYKKIQKIKSFQTKTTEVDFLEKMVVNKIPVGSCSVLWKKIIFNEIRFNENLEYAEEWECFQRIFSDYNSGIIIDAILYYNRKHPKSNTGEFYTNNSLRVASKKQAIVLVTQNLVNNNQLNESMLNYLLGFALFFRDKQMLNVIIAIAKVPYKKKTFFNFKFMMYPLWKLYKKIKK